MDNSDFPGYTEISGRTSSDFMKLEYTGVVLTT